MDTVITAMVMDIIILKIITATKKIEALLPGSGIS